MKLSTRFKAMQDYILNLQTTIVSALEKEDGKLFTTDTWTREKGGGGLTRVIADGNIFEKGAVNTSSVWGELPDVIAKHFKLSKAKFAACGLSLILHPKNPHVPTTHMNVRYFETDQGQAWYGGGNDLTPYYPHEADFIHFHQTLKTACNAVLPNSYADFKKQCDEYFYIPHRKEMRGIGGVFFDYQKDDLDKSFELVQSLGNAFLDSYLPIVQGRKAESYSDNELEFQAVRRGRYVEFNLIYDKGTLFGLKTDGRIESILVSLPKHVQFLYNWQPKADTPQALMTKYYQAKNWL